MLLNPNHYESRGQERESLILPSVRFSVENQASMNDTVEANIYV